MLLGRSSSEELDVTGVDAEELSEPASSLTPTYEELVDVMARTTAKLSLDWSVDTAPEIAPGRLR